MSKADISNSASTETHLARRLGLFDATMIVMGGIIGAGIFTNPYVVAQQVHTPFLILGAWALGGLIALGTSPWMTIRCRFLVVGSGTGTAASKAWEYGWIGLE